MYTSSLLFPTHFEFDRSLIERLDGSGPRYTSYPTADRFTSSFTEDNYIQALRNRHVGGCRKTISLYLHIPFCDTICYYCGCNKIITKDKSRADQYLDYLEKEIELTASFLEQRERVIQLHFGGGTPSFLSDAQFERVMKVLQRHFTLLEGGEYSIEVDPRKVVPETLFHWAKLGLNRISVGVQDFESAVQQAVNRVQSEAETMDVIQAAREAGFKSVSVDLIYGLPFQTAASMRCTLDKVIALAPDRLALYNYAHLPNIFPPQRRIQEKDLPLAKEKLDILQNSIQQLMEAGYIFIGMDHFAKPDDELALALSQGRLQRNFQGYSTHANCDMLGFGVSSISQVGKCYSQNQRKLEAYYADLDQGRLPVMRGLVLNQDDLIRRHVIQSLMCRFSLSFDMLNESFQIDSKTYFAPEIKKIEEFAQLGLLTFDGNFLMVEPKGRLLIRNIAMLFDRHLREKTTQATYSKTL